MAEQLIYEDTDKRIFATVDGEDRTERVEWVKAAALEARMNAVAALAEKTDATAQEVAQAARDAHPVGSPV